MTLIELSALVGGTSSFIIACIALWKCRKVNGTPEVAYRTKDELADLIALMLMDPQLAGERRHFLRDQHQRLMRLPADKSIRTR